MIWKAMLIPSMGYVVGLILGFIVYRKPRVYEQRNVNDRNNFGTQTLCANCYCHCHTSYVLVQTFTDSMIFGALAGYLFSFVSRAYRWYELDEQFVDGVKLMAYIGVVILTANGFAGVMNATGDIDSLVKSLTGLTGDHKLISIIVMYLIGLIVTLGIGSSLQQYLLLLHYLYLLEHQLV